MLFGRVLLLIGLLICCSAQQTLTNSARAPSPSAQPAAGPAQATPSTGKVSVTVNVSSISQNNQPVLVSFSGVSNPTDADVVALYFANGSADATRPLKYKWARTSPGYTTTGSGSLSFILLNQRQPISFFFFKNVTDANGFSNLTYIGRSGSIGVANPNEPVQGHLALTSDPTQVLVQWTTRDPGTPTVSYGTSSGQYTTNATGNTHTYSAADLCGSPANDTAYVPPGSLHTATLSMLTPSTQYFYKFGDPAFGFSKEHSFYTAAPVGASSTVHFLATADLGHTTLDGAVEYDYDESTDPLNYSPTGTVLQAYNTLTQLIYDNEYQQGASRGTVEAMANDTTQKWTLYLLNGDVSYARGEESMWDDFMDQMEQLTANVPWMLVSGNHEMDWPTGGDRYTTTGGGIDSGGECGVPYHNRFYMPYNTSTSWTDGYGRPHGAEWYSYDHGPIHFLSYSTEFDFSAGSPQYQFIVDDLANVNRNNTPWVVVNGHRPIYTTSSSGGSLSSVTTVARDLRMSLEDVLFQYEVDLTWHGHDHIYERTCPVYKSLCQPQNADGSQSAPMHVVIGNAGYELSWFANPNVPPYWDVIYLEHGYQRCTVNATSFACEEVSSLSGNVLDSWQLTKPAGWQPKGSSARKAAIASFNGIYNTNNLIELYGLPGANYSVIEEPVYGALMGANMSLLTMLQNMSDIVTATVNGAVPGGEADTMVDIWDTLQPFYNVLAQYVNANTTIASAASGLLPMLQQVEKVANAYTTTDGLWYISSRASQGLPPTVKATVTPTPTTPASSAAGR